VLDTIGSQLLENAESHRRSSKTTTGQADDDEQIILRPIGHRFGKSVPSTFVDLGNRLTEISARCRARR
jgi:hypothetical protein